MSTIYILWLRQLKRYLRSKARIVGSLAQPLLFLVAMGFGFGPFFQKAGQGNYMEFLSPGIIAMSILFTAIFTGIDMIWDRQFGFLKETFVAPVPRSYIITGRVLGGATVAAIQGAIVLALTFIFGFRVGNWFLIPATLVIMLVVATLFAALGSAIATQLEDMQGFQLIMNFLVMPMFFFSGALFPLNGLPSILTIVARFDPMTYGVDSLRVLLTSAGGMALSPSIIVLFVLAAGLLWLTTVLFSRMEL